MAESAPLVTVVIPTYNRADLLRECLASVVAQTFRDWEAVVVNNFSADDTIAVVESFGDKRVQLVNFRNEGVIAASRNLGAKKARGRYIAFLDSDDTWAPEKLSRCTQVLQSDPAIDIVCHSEVWSGPAQQKIVHYGPEERARYESLLFDGNCISTSTVVVKREWFEKLGGFSEARELITTEDYDLWLRFSKAGAKFAFLDEPLGLYRQHENNEVGKNIARYGSAISKVLKNHFAAWSEKSLGVRLRMRKRLARVNFEVASMAFAARRLPEAFGYLAKGFWLFPFDAAVYGKVVRKLLGR